MLLLPIQRAIQNKASISGLIFLSRRHYTGKAVFYLASSVLFVTDNGVLRGQCDISMAVKPWARPSGRGLAKWASACCLAHGFEALNALLFMAAAS